MHTKGPWELAPCSNGGFILRRGDTHGKNRHPQSHLQIVPEGDARLIAAAPDLLQELQNIANADYRHWEDGHNTAEEFVLWAKSRARHAISKAEGR